MPKGNKRREGAIAWGEGIEGLRAEGDESRGLNCSLPASAGSGGGVGSGDAAPCLGEEVAQGQSAMGLAVGVPSAKPLARPGHGSGGLPPLRSNSGPKGREASRWTRRHQQTGRLPHFSPFIRDQFARAWAGYPYHCFDHDSTVVLGAYNNCTAKQQHARADSRLLSIMPTCLLINLLANLSSMPPWAHCRISAQKSLNVLPNPVFYWIFSLLSP